MFRWLGEMGAIIRYNSIGRDEQVEEEAAKVGGGGYVHQERKLLPIFFDIESRSPRSPCGPSLLPPVRISGRTFQISFRCPRAPYTEGVWDGTIWASAVQFAGWLAFQVDFNSSG